MTHNPLIWIGLAGIDGDDNARARWWQQRLHGLMIAVALLALPAYVLDSAGEYPGLHHAATLLDVVIFLAFLVETGWMLHVTSFPGRYLVENWLNVVILIGSAASALGAPTEGVALIRVARVAVGSLVLVRGLTAFRVLFTRRGAPLLVGAGCLMMLCGGAVFYWVEPTIGNYWDGLWLAFVTGTTIGYGDFAPTSAAARAFAVFVTVIGVALMTLFTANVVAFFVGRDEASATDVTQTLAILREDVAQSSRAESARLLQEVQQDLRALRADIVELRKELGVRQSDQAPPPLER